MNDIQLPTGNKNIIRSDTLHHRLPRFITGWLTADIAFCSVRLFLIALMLPGVVSSPGTAYQYTEIITGFFLGSFGITGDIMLLKKMKTGLYLAAVALSLTAAGIIMGFWQTFEDIALMSGAQKSVGVAGGILVAAVRIVLNGFYIAAVIRLKKLLDASAQTGQV